MWACRARRRAAGRARASTSARAAASPPRATQVVAQHGREVSLAALDAMPLAEAVTREALRLTPPSAAVFRRALVDLEVRWRGGGRRRLDMRSAARCPTRMRCAVPCPARAAACQVCGKFVPAGSRLMLSTLMGQVRA